MERKLRAMQKSTEFLRQVFKVLTIAASILFLWMLAGWIFGLFYPPPQMQAEPAASGGWSISAGPFSVLIRQGYFAPGSELASVKGAYLTEGGMNLVGGACQWAVFLLAYMTGYYRAAVEKCVKDGSLKGTGNGEINVSEDLCRMLTIFDRKGKLD